MGYSRKDRNVWCTVRPKSLYRVPRPPSQLEQLGNALPAEIERRRGRSSLYVHASDRSADEEHAERVRERGRTRGDDRERIQSGRTVGPFVADIPCCSSKCDYFHEKDGFRSRRSVVKPFRMRARSVKLEPECEQGLRCLGRIRR